MVVRNNRKLTKDRAKALVATDWQRVAAAQGLDGLAAEGACSRRCIEKALAHDSLPEFHTLLNTLDADPTALDSSLAEKGFCLVPLEMGFDQDMTVITELSALLTDWLDAMKDNRRDHTETLRIATRIRQLLPKLRGVVGEADKLRAVA